MATTINASTTAGLVSTADTSGVLQLQAQGTTVLNGELGKALALQGATSTTGCGIAFPTAQVQSTNPNTLDDYEEGTWTPAFTGVTSPVYLTQYGTYTKIGRSVFFVGRIALTSGTGSGASVTVTGLPFTAAADSTGGSGGGTAGYTEITSSASFITISAGTATALFTTTGITRLTFTGSLVGTFYFSGFYYTDV